MKGQVKVRRIAVFGPLIGCAGHKQALAVKTGMPAACGATDKRVIQRRLRTSYIDQETGERMAFISAGQLVKVT